MLNTHFMTDMSQIDDQTAAYVLEQRKHFEDLRQVAAQLAGLLVLAAAGANGAAPGHPLLETAEQLFHDAADGIRSARVPLRARQHHHRVVAAIAAIRHALDAAQTHLGRQSPPGDFDPILVPLRAGYTHLQRAADALPGFDMIAFDRGCCARSESGLSRSDRGVLR
jgi:hypothetical protein